MSKSYFFEFSIKKKGNIGLKREEKRVHHEYIKSMSQSKVFKIFNYIYPSLTLVVAAAHPHCHRYSSSLGIFVTPSLFLPPLNHPLSFVTSLPLRRRRIKTMRRKNKCNEEEEIKARRDYKKSRRRD